MADNRLDPISYRDVIVNDDGTPTAFFIQQWNAQIDVNIELEPGDVLTPPAGGLEGGGSTSEGLSLSIADTAVTAATYGSATMNPCDNCQRQGPANFSH